MAALNRVGVSLLVLLVAASCAVAVSAAGPGCTGPDCAVAAPAPPEDYTWSRFIADNQVRDADTTEMIATLGVDGVLDTTAAAPRGWTIAVDQSGKGKYKKVQQAINSIPKGNKKRITIVIYPGVYREKILIPKEKPFITFKCVNRKAVLVWGDTAEKAGGTSKSASTAVESRGFIATDCTFVNSAPAPEGGAVGKQAVALRIQGDQGAFYRCGFFGAQDTLYDKEGRHYFKQCEIVGSIDYIFGDGQSFYEACNIKSIAKSNSGSITAQKRESNSRTGFVFFACRIGGSGTIYLGRAWGTHSRVVFIRCTIANMIRPIGWQDWNDPKRQKTIFYAEHSCYGPGANRKGRAKWSRVLTAAEAKPFSSINYIDGKSWL